VDRRGGRGHDGVVMFVLGTQRDRPSTVVFTSAGSALAIAANPEAMPTVLQVILSLGAVDLAKLFANARLISRGRQINLCRGSWLSVVRTLRR